MKFKLGMTAALLASLLAACGGDGNSAGTDVTQANKAPVANADFFNVLQGNTATLSVLANDIDPESGALTLAATPSIDASKGTITTSSDKKTLDLTLNASFTGDISFSYLVADAQGNQTTGQATVTVKALQSLSAKQDSTCVVSSVGAVKCWGGNDFGQLGDGSTQAFKNTPVTVANLSGAKQITMGYNHACAITQTGAVSCWGDNNNGQLGDGTQTKRTQATAVVGLSAKAIQLALSYQSSCALLETGNIQCWGSNSQGELGVGQSVVPTRSLSPQTLTLGSNLKAKRIVAGKNHLCAISQNDSLFCWGANDLGQLGLNDTAIRYQATQVSLAGSIQQLAAGFAHTCAATTNTVSCWGDNSFAQLGNNASSTTPVLSPVSVLGLTTAVDSLALGKDHSCAVSTDNKTYCWGSRKAGQTAQTVDNTLLDKQATQVSVLTGKRHLSAGDFHTCSIEDNSIVKCWGKNDLGQLANGSTAQQSASPVSVTLN